MKSRQILQKMEQPISVLCDNSEEQSNSAHFNSETDVSCSAVYCFLS